MSRTICRTEDAGRETATQDGAIRPRIPPLMRDENACKRFPVAGARTPRDINEEVNEAITNTNCSGEI